MDSLSARAAELGIDPDYVDGYGLRRSIEQDSLRRVIGAVSSATIVPGKPRLPSSVVLRQGRSQPLVVHPHAPQAMLHWRVASCNYAAGYAVGQIRATQRSVQALSGPIELLPNY